MSSTLPPIDDLLTEFDNGKVPRSETWHTLITGLYLNTDNVQEIEGWYNTVQELTVLNQDLNQNIKSQHDQIEIWYGQVDSWQQQVSLSEATAGKYATTATEQATRAQAWAAHPAGDVVESGLYSSLHYARQSSGFADNSAASADRAAEQATLAGQIQQSVTSSEQSTLLYKTQAQEAAEQARSSQQASSTSQQAAASSATTSTEASEQAAESAQTATTKAKHASAWAANPVDKPVDNGLYSSLHYAQKSSESAASALDSQNAAASSVTVATQQADRAKEEADKAQDAIDSVTIKEAPLDGKQYVRQDGKWVVAPETDNEWRPGDIKMFAGSENQIQTGWQLCNGQGKTSNNIQIPDLRNRFIVGSGSSYSVGSKGGSTSATTNTTGNHSHSVGVYSTTLSVSQMPSHTHSNPQSASGGTSTVNDYGPGGNVYNGVHVISGSSGSSYSHNHSANCSSTGNHSHSVNITPPYYALAFIIKL